ncbi:MAG: Gfo/Idh/MocA family oxidoreductase [Sedimentisphaerales bacterium]|jgi:predicted dehydrogenase|nr:Gfo/Idh/MocA family oxidoreductase [Sedimentisphaerales bacterium]HNY79652.1 Gfo/Idh/MocA family oxidoreductase [Sedimentisphaerales bacterium]HOC62584.1 Gfo/Idh/MocA family oxidoreductase [Sedimentisphaerales bacterium]HOH65292.1 Gfo/Idh/MocA family oxidoreductase [Sedimentisphaerales bacterium]HPY48757.1 Gfo/Idh/MocA family oxidoreductase [Sedimentisphaerales bacterium]
MKPTTFHPTRRGFLKAMLAAQIMPAFVPARLLRAGQAPSSRITLGVIGIGAQGLYDMRNFLGYDDVRVTAVCDVNRRNIETARGVIGEAYGSRDVKVFSDFREMNADRSIDAVLMALPVHWHSIAAQDTILQGKHIYHEKPMAMSFEEARRVRDAVHKTGVVFQFGTQQRSDLYFRWACELALNGRLGKVKEIQVSVPGGKEGPPFPEQPVPEYVDWDRWVGPAPITAFHEDKLQRDNHENITNFSLGMISCWGIHHLDIAQWGNSADRTGPRFVEGEGVFPKEGAFDAILRWKVRFEYAGAAPMTFVQDGTEGYEHGIRFVGESGWAHVTRGALNLYNPDVLRDPQNKCGTMPIRLAASPDHMRNFVDAIRNGTRAICDIDTAVRSDILCQIALIAVKRARRLEWDQQAERFVDDDQANAMLRSRAFRGDWRLKEA